MLQGREPRAAALLGADAPRARRTSRPSRSSAAWTTWASRRPGTGASRRAAEQAAAEARARPAREDAAAQGKHERRSRFRTGTVAIVGRPNVGKSTLLNKLVGAHVAITSRKAQTTRHRIQGILTDERSQFVFVDTPGYQTQHQNALNRGMNRTVGQVAYEVDVVVLVIDAHGLGRARRRRCSGCFPRGVPVILALNKVDKVGDKAKRRRHARRGGDASATSPRSFRSARRRARS